MSVTVITDTTAALRPETARRLGIKLVPLTLIVGDRACRDGEVAAAELLRRTDQRITTAGPPPGEFLRALGPAPGGAVIVTVAAALSSTHSAALVAAGLSEAPIEVVDSTSAAGGQALVAVAAARAAAEGGPAGGDIEANVEANVEADVARVAAAARAAAGQVRLIGCVESLDRLARSGRVPGLAAAAARRVGLSFMFELRAGRIRPLRPAGGRAAAIDRMVRRCAADPGGAGGPGGPGGTGGTGAVADIVVLESAPTDFTKELRERLRERVSVGLDLTGTFGSAILVHAGPEVAGLAWRWRDGPA